MTLQQNEVTFSTNRTTVAPAPVSVPRAIVLSETKGLAEMVANGLTAEGATVATAVTMSLSDFVATPDLSLSEVSICLFEIKLGDDAQIKAIRTMRELGGEDLKILGLTSEVLTLTTARQLMDAGVHDVVPLDVGRTKLDDAAPLAPAAEAGVAQRGAPLRNGMIIGVAQTRGGIGATTFALNLATLLAAKPKKSRKAPTVDAPRVAVIDLDLQNGTLGASIDVHENPAFIEMLRNGTMPDADLIQSAMVPHGTGFDVLPAPVEFVPLDSMRPEMMATLLDELRLAYDYIVIDMPRTMVEWIDPILARADKMYLLSDTAVHSVRQSRRMIDFYCEDHVTLPLDVIVSLERKPFSTSSAMKEAEKFLSRKLAHWIPRDDRTAKLATDRGQTMIASKPKSLVRKPMTPMIEELTAYFAADQRRQA